MKAVPRIKQTETYGAVLTDVRWSIDSHEVYFLAETSDGDRRLHRLDVQSGTVAVLSPGGYTVARFDLAGHLIVCSAWHSNQEGSAPREENVDINADAMDVTGLSLNRILFPESRPAPTSRELWIVRDDLDATMATPVPSPAQFDMSWLSEAFAVSPHGHWLIQLEPATNVPTSWERYEAAKGSEYLRIHKDDVEAIAADNIWRLKEYSLVNLDDGTSTSLVSAPQDFPLGYPPASTAIWSADERHVLLTNTFLPLDGVGEDEQLRRLRPCAVADVQLPSRESHCIVPVNDPATSSTVDSLMFGKSSGEVTLRVEVSPGRREKRTYILQNNAWRLARTEALTGKSGGVTSEPVDGSRDLAVTVKQGLNESPTLWATNTRTGRGKKLWDPNPQLAGLRFGDASVYHWNDRGGRAWEGGLVKPTDYIPGRRYPLVIQIYNFEKDQFLTDGLFPTAFAARALASAGIAVLQIQRSPHTFDVTEKEIQLAGIESAIDTLADAGIVDPHNVGIVGFSATSWYVESALIRFPGRFRAAIIADGIDLSYMQYHLWGVSSSEFSKEFEQIIGSAPVGDSGLKQWLTQAPGFHVDKIETPVRLEAIKPGSILSEWEIYSSLRLQKKPVELIYFPEGTHVHQRPLERLASQEGAVDWFRFWLQAYVDPDSRKRTQYKRWESMKAQQTSIQAATP